MRQHLFTAFKIIISVGLLGFLVWRVGLAELAAIAASTDYRFLLAAIVLWTGSVIFSVWKWDVMLKAQGIQVPFRALMAHYYIGLFFNNFLPMVGQDVVRGYGIARYTERAHEVAISVLVDRLVGLIAFIVGGAAMSVVIVTVYGRTDMTQFAVITCVIAAGVLAAFAMLLSRRLRGLAEVLFHLPLLKIMLPTYQKLSEAFLPYRNNLGVLVFGWVLATLSMVDTHFVNWLVSFAVKADVGLEYVFLFNALVVFAPLIIPSLGGLGVTQGAFVVLYATLGKATTDEHAFAMGLMMQVVVILSSLPGALVWLQQRDRKGA
ncbi:MAG: flippase-like domain-containing protein [Chloroflexi bacterium]|nr:flippase-like domain-containing protein [Chloroflexota bacterium]